MKPIDPFDSFEIICVVDSTERLRWPTGIFDPVTDGIGDNAWSLAYEYCRPVASAFHLTTSLGVEVEL